VGSALCKGGGVGARALTAVCFSASVYCARASSNSPTLRRALPSAFRVEAALILLCECDALGVEAG
jgi:hypothetical protein